MKQIDKAAWNYAVHLIKNLDRDKRKCYNIEKQGVFDRNIYLIRYRIEKIEEALGILDEYERQAVLLNINRGISLRDLEQRGIPLSCSSMKRAKRKLIMKVISELCI